VPRVSLLSSCSQPRWMSATAAGAAGLAAVMRIAGFELGALSVVGEMQVMDGGEHRPAAGCPGCSMFADQVGHLAHLRARYTSFALVSGAPVAAIERYTTAWAGPSPGGAGRWERRSAFPDFDPAGIHDLGR
jgi:hypothetical protein